MSSSTNRQWIDRKGPRGSRKRVLSNNNTINHIQRMSHPTEGSPAAHSKHIPTFTFAALSSHLTPRADALIVYIRMHTGNNFTCPYLDVSMLHNNKLFIMLLHFRYLNRQNSSVHPWCGMNCSCTSNHTQPLSLVLMAPDSIQSTKDALVRLFWYLEGKFHLQQQH